MLKDRDLTASSHPFTEKVAGSTEVPASSSAGKEILRDLTHWCERRNSIREVLHRSFPTPQGIDLLIAQKFRMETAKPIFDLNEVMSVHASVQKTQEFLPCSRMPVVKMDDGRHVLQQSGWWGGSAACVAMLKLDNGHDLDTMQILFSRFGCSQARSEELERCGMGVVHFCRTADLHFHEPESSLRILEGAISRRGPAIVSLYPETLGIHAVIADSIDLDAGLVDLREPYHGWCISVCTEAFLKQLCGPLDIIQLSGSS